MTTLTNSFETGLPNGTTVTAANSGNGSAGAPFDTVTIDSPNTMVYSTASPAHGALGARITIGASAANFCYCEWSTSLLAVQSGSTIYTRIGFSYPTVPPNFGEFALLRGLLATNQRWRVSLTNTAKIAVFGQSSTTIATSATTLAAATHYRVEAAAAAHVSAGAIEVRIYLGDSQTPVETLGPFTGQAMGGPIDRVRFGVGLSAFPSVATQLDIDDVGASTTTWLGPAVALPSVTHAWVGAVAHNSATVSYGTTNTTSARLVVSTSADLSSPVYSPAAAPNSNGFVKLIRGGLDPDTAYFYGVEADGTLLADGRGSFRTDPAPGSRASFSVAFGSCQQTNSNAETFQAIAGRVGPYGKARRMLHEGDLHYRDFGAGTTAADVANQFKSSLATPNMRMLLANVPTTYVWDNHDWGGPDSHAAAPAGPVTADVYRQVVPHYPLATAGNTAIHQSFVIGRVRFVILDTRSQRSPRTDAESSAKTLLGAEQKQWFKNQLLLPEPFKVVVSGIYWRRDSVSGDRWGSYQTEWAEIRDWVAANTSAIGGVLVISGDRHALYADNGTGGGAGGTYWPNVGGAPLDQGSTESFETWTHGYYAGTPGTNLKAFGWLDVDDAGTSITVTYSGITALDGQTRVSMTVTAQAAADLAAARWGIHL
ncbi:MULTISPECIES: alkaline phosphatase D family protein [unclassified Micromonospora]|uniref:alkaline phosphatase D family protein n=1 Tax=unclassified Micromonospora TaxID=2617518 RepID=UPI003324F205